MNETDVAVLEFLAQLEVNGGERIDLPPTTVWVNLTDNLDVIDKSQSTVARRMKRLEEHDLLEKTDDKRTYYRITDLGIRYVDGDITREELMDNSDSDE